MLVHLMLELYNCKRELLSDEPLLRRVLDEYPSRVEMEKVSPQKTATDDSFPNSRPGLYPGSPHSVDNQVIFRYFEAL